MTRQTNPFEEHAYGEELANRDQARALRRQAREADNTGWAFPDSARTPIEQVHGWGKFWLRIAIMVAFGVSTFYFFFVR